WRDDRQGGGHASQDARMADRRIHGTAARALLPIDEAFRRRDAGQPAGGVDRALPGVGAASAGPSVGASAPVAMAAGARARVLPEPAGQPTPERAEAIRPPIPSAD